MGNGCSSASRVHESSRHRLSDKRSIERSVATEVTDEIPPATPSVYVSPMSTSRGTVELVKTVADIAYENAKHEEGNRFFLNTDEDKAYRKKWSCYTHLFGDLEEQDVLFKWNDEYELGVAMVDRQHFKLVELINELHYAEKRAKEDRWIIGYVIDALVQYTDYHFKAEEKMLETYNFCDEEELAGHKEKHRAFVQKIMDFKDKYQNVEQLSVGQEILNFLKSWLSGHILNSDRSICSFVIKKIKKEQGLETDEEAPVEGDTQTEEDKENGKEVEGDGKENEGSGVEKEEEKREEINDESHEESDAENEESHEKSDAENEEQEENEEVDNDNSQQDGHEETEEHEEEQTA